MKVFAALFLALVAGAQAQSQTCLNATGNADGTTIGNAAIAACSASLGATQPTNISVCAATVGTFYGTLDFVLNSLETIRAGENCSTELPPQFAGLCNPAIPAAFAAPSLLSAASVLAVYAVYPLDFNAELEAAIDATIKDLSCACMPISSGFVDEAGNLTGLGLTAKGSGIEYINYLPSILGVGECSFTASTSDLVGPGISEDVTCLITSCTAELTACKEDAGVDGCAEFLTGIAAILGDPNANFQEAMASPKMLNVLSVGGPSTKLAGDALGCTICKCSTLYNAVALGTSFDGAVPAESKPLVVALPIFQTYLFGTLIADSDGQEGVCGADVETKAPVTAPTESEDSGVATYVVSSVAVLAAVFAAN